MCAIELAAGQLVSLSVSELLERLDQRFELLTAGRGRRGARRRQGLEMVLEDTWSQLSVPERDLLDTLAVFPSTFDLDAVEGVVDPSLVNRLGALRASSPGR